MINVKPVVDGARGVARGRRDHRCLRHQLRKFRPNLGARPRRFGVNGTEDYRQGFRAIAGPAARGTTAVGRKQATPIQRRDARFRAVTGLSRRRL